MTKSGSFIQKKFIRPCLEIEPVIPQMWGKHLTTVLPSRCKGLISSLQSKKCLPNMCGAWFMVWTNNDDVTRQLVNILLTICSQWLGFAISLHVKILHSIINHLTTDFVKTY